MTLYDCTFIKLRPYNNYLNEISFYEQHCLAVNVRVVSLVNSKSRCANRLNRFESFGCRFYKTLSDICGLQYYLFLFSVLLNVIFYIYLLICVYICKNSGCIYLSSMTININ